MIFYIFNKDSLLPEPVNFKPLLILPVVVILAFLFREIYFNTKIFEDTDWKKEKVHLTPEEKTKQHIQITSYK